MRRLITLALAFCSIVPLTGCATILAGKTQTVSIDSNPSGARCELRREGRVIGSVEKTPGAVTITKTKHDIDVICTKEGFGESKAFAESGTEGATFGNIILGGLVGWGVDSAVGADNKYPEMVAVNLAAPPSSSAIASTFAPPSQTSGSANELKRRIAALEQLRTAGLLTTSEYQQKREDILRGL